MTECWWRSRQSIRPARTTSKFSTLLDVLPLIDKIGVLQDVSSPGRDTLSCLHPSPAISHRLYFLLLSITLLVGHHDITTIARKFNMPTIATHSMKDTKPLHHVPAPSRIEPNTTRPHLAGSYYLSEFLNPHHWIASRLLDDKWPFTITTSPAFQQSVRL